MPTRTAALAQLISPSNASIAAFTCPAGETVIVKSATLFNSTGGALAGILYLLAVSTDVQSMLVSQSILSAGFAEWSGWRVMKPGDRVYFQPGGAGLHLWVSGTRLIGVAA